MKRSKIKWAGRSANEHGFAHFILLLFVILAVVGAGVLVSKRSNDSSDSAASNSAVNSAAIEVGKQISASKCTGSGPTTLSVSPMKDEDVSSIIPYGLMVGEHVTPIDHQYFAPAVFDSPRDSYEVRAPADGNIVSIQHRTSGGGSFYEGRILDEYRLVITYSCTFFSYFDLITSLSADIQAQIGSQQNASVNIPIKAGQVLGKIGGQTLDFAVWDTTKTLSGFLVPEHYKGEIWKIHTVDPLDYSSPELKAFMISKNPRKVEPTSGKIDYDIDGKLAGNWFIKGQGGYVVKENQQDSWKGHMAFAPNNYDPTLWQISSGAWGPNGTQFAISPAQPKPDVVGVSDGLLKYELYQVMLLVDGKMPSNPATYNGQQTITAAPGEYSMGCMLVQVTGQREMKSEGFPGQACDSLSAFTSAAKTYER